MTINQADNSLSSDNSWELHSRIVNSRKRRRNLSSELSVQDFTNDHFLNKSSSSSSEGTVKKRRIEIKKQPQKFAENYNVMDTDGNTSQVVNINGTEYPIHLKVENKVHKIFHFERDVYVATPYTSILSTAFESLTPIGSNFCFLSQNIILKCYNSQANPKMIAQTIREELEAFMRMLKDGVPMPRVYVNPDSLKNSIDEKIVDIWIIEKTETEIPPNDPAALDFAKKWLTKSAKENRIIIPDFYPHNVKFKEGYGYLVDPSLLQCKFPPLKNLHDFLLAWSYGKKENYDFLIADFPEELKKEFSQRLEQSGQQLD